MRCICCGTTIKPLYEDKPEQELIFSENIHSIWDGGIVSKISAGFGSSNDGEVYVIGVCDECINKKVNSGVVAHVGDYIEPKSFKENTFDAAKQNWIDKN